MAKKRKVKAAKTQTADIVNNDYHSGAADCRNARKAKMMSVNNTIRLSAGSLLEYFLMGIKEDQINKVVPHDIGDYEVQYNGTGYFWTWKGMESTLEAMRKTSLFTQEEEPICMSVNYRGDGVLTSKDFPGVNLLIYELDTWSLLSYDVDDVNKVLTFYVGQTFNNFYEALEQQF